MDPPHSGRPSPRSARRGARGRVSRRALMDPTPRNHGRLTLEEMAASRPRGLRVLRDLLDRLDGEGVRYCHWKSNEHLFEGMVGLTDLDVLFERTGTPRLDRIFGEAGYKRLQTTPMRWHPGLE